MKKYSIEENQKAWFLYETDGGEKRLIGKFSTKEEAQLHADIRNGEFKKEELKF